jgi:hypothetical protein
LIDACRTNWIAATLEAAKSADGQRAAKRYYALLRQLPTLTTFGKANGFKC